MIFIDCGDGNPDDYDIEFAKKLRTMLDESKYGIELTETEVLYENAINDMENNKNRYRKLLSMGCQEDLH